jgi:hypothetical protein
MSGIDWNWGVSNKGPGPLLVWLEPWAEEFEVPVGSTITMHVSCTGGIEDDEDDDAVSAECTTEHLVVWADAGQIVRVSIDGDLQDTASATIPVPGGFGGSTKDLLTLMFGGQPSARLGGVSNEAPPPRSFWKKAKRYLRLE